MRELSSSSGRGSAGSAFSTGISKRDVSNAWFEGSSEIGDEKRLSSIGSAEGTSSKILSEAFPAGVSIVF